MTRFKILLLFMLIANIVSAQTRQLSGLVTDATNTGVPSATVKVKGSTIHTLTGTDGKFTLSAPSGNIFLEISSIGFDPIEVAVAGTDNNISVTMTSATGSLGEVVVTALGIRRDKKALTYASQLVSGDELRRAANINFVDALSGKAAGLDIKVSNSGAGGSTKAVLRGNKSFSALVKRYMLLMVSRW
ncbi:MAG: carboxypeptidase-like regulatory domain-containing protein [Bacteroidota bacterium]